MNMILFEKRKYKVRQVQITNLGELNIASTFLNKKLFSDNGLYKSEEARVIDELIYFFVEPKKLRLSDNKLSKYVRENCL